MTSSKRPADGHEFVEGLVRIGKQELMKTLGVSEDQAQLVMTGVATRVVGEYARTYLYVPVSFDLRDGEIWRKYCEPGRGADGRPGAPAYSHARIEELAAEYGRTVRQIYSVVSSRRKLDRAERRFPTDQPLLEGLDPAA